MVTFSIKCHFIPIQQFTENLPLPNVFGDLVGCTKCGNLAPNTNAILFSGVTVYSFAFWST